MIADFSFDVAAFRRNGCGVVVDPLDGTRRVVGMNHFLDANPGWVKKIIQGHDTIEGDTFLNVWVETPVPQSPISIHKERLETALPKIKTLLSSLVISKEYIKSSREIDGQKYKFYVIKDKILVGFSKERVGSGTFFKAKPVIVLDRTSREMGGFKVVMSFVKSTHSPLSEEMMKKEIIKRCVLARKASTFRFPVHTDEQWAGYIAKGTGTQKAFFVANLAECIGSQAGRFQLQEWKPYLNMCAQLAESLLAIHEHGEVHGDIKAENCLLVEGIWKFADLSDRKIGTPTAPGQTFEYIPPEHRRFLQDKIGKFPTCTRTTSKDALLFHYNNKSYEQKLECSHIVRPENEIFSFGFLLINLYYSRLREGLLEREPLPPLVLERVVDIIFRMTGIRLSEFPTFRSVVDANDPLEPATAVVDPRLGPAYHNPGLRPSMEEVVSEFNILLSENTELITVIPGRPSYSRTSPPEFSFKTTKELEEFPSRLLKFGSCTLQYGIDGPILVFGRYSWLDANYGWKKVCFNGMSFFWRAPKSENPIDTFKGRIVAQEKAIIDALKERRGSASDFEYTKYKTADFVIRVFPFPGQGVLYLASFSKYYIDSGSFFKAMPTARIDIDSGTITKFFALLKPVSNTFPTFYEKESTRRIETGESLKDCSHVHREIAYVKYKDKHHLIAPLATQIGSYVCDYGLETAQKYLQFALGVATGVAQIHARGFCVGDIKSNNCLFDGVWKIADFSLYSLGELRELKQSLYYASPQHLQFLQKTIGNFPAYYRNATSSCLLIEFNKLNSERKEQCYYAVTAQDEVYSLGILLIEVYYARIKEGLSSLPEETIESLARIIWQMTGINVKIFPTLGFVFDVIDPVPPRVERTDSRLGSPYFQPEERPSAQEVADYFNALLSRESPMA